MGVRIFKTICSVGDARLFQVVQSGHLLATTAVKLNEKTKSSLCELNHAVG